MRNISRDTRIGLALGGGAVLGGAHIGVLRAMKEYDIPISCIAGTSIGALVASLFAFGMEWEEIRKIALNLRWLDISRISLSKYGLLSNKKLAEVIHDILGQVTFENARVPLAIIATDISTGEMVILKEGDVAASVMASTCIPGLFVPVEIEGRMLVDGGITEIVPVSPLREMGADIVLAVNLIAKHRHRRPENIIDVLMNSFSFTLMNSMRLQLVEADMVIAPDLSAYNLIDTDQTPDLIEAGYAEAKAALKNFKTYGSGLHS